MKGDRRRRSPFMVGTVVYLVPVLWFLLVPVRLVAANPPVPELTDAKLTTKFEDLQKLSIRTITEITPADESGPVTLFATTKLTDFESQRWWAGAETPVFVLGSLRYNGLFRELNGPTSTGPSSSRFTEKTKFTIDTSLDPGKLKGAAVHPLSGSLSLFLLGRDNPAKHAGALLRLPLNEEGLTVTGIVSYSFDGQEEFEPQTGQEGGNEGWFYDTVPYAGDDLFHTAVGLTFKRKWITIGYAGGLMCGPISPPGLFARAHIDLRTSLVEVAFTVTESGKEYRTWWGEIPNVRYMYGGKVTFFPKAPINLSGTYSRKVKQLNIVPEPYRLSVDKLSLSALFELKPLTMEGLWTWKLDISELGEVSLDQSLFVPVRLECKPIELGITPLYRWDYYGESEKKLDFDFGIQSSPLSFDCGFGIIKRNEWLLEADMTIGLSFAGENKNDKVWDTGGYLTVDLEEITLSEHEGDSEIGKIESNPGGASVPLWSRLRFSVGWEVSK